MLSAGLRLVLAVAAPLVGAAVVHELRHRVRLAAVVATVAIATCGGLTLSVASGVSGGGSLERSFGSAIPGVDLTARADSAAVAVILIGCLAALLALPRRRQDGERLAALLLCLGGTATVAAAGNLVLDGGGVQLIAAGTLLLCGRRGPGSRSAAILAGLIGAGGLALLAAAAELVAAAGSSDLAFVPQGAVGGALAIPWALGGAALILSAAVPGDGASAARDWAAIAALPAGYLVLLRLQESAGGQLPGNASIALAVVGLTVACLGAYTARRAVTLAAAGRSVVAVLAGVLVCLFGGSLATSGTLLAGVFLALELALLAAPSWNRSPSGWSAASIALTALPGGAAFAVVAVALGTVAQRGVTAFVELAILVGVVAAAAISGARAVAAPRRGWRPAFPGAVLTVGAGLAGGLFPGLALRYVAAPLAGGAASVDLDAGALGAPGGGFAAGYFTIGAAVLLAGAAAAVVVAGDEPIAAAAPQARALGVPPLRPLLHLRRRIAPASRLVATGLHNLDQWLESQPRTALVVAAAVAAVAWFR
ncbi:MAG: hypothetical protein M3Z57_07375 [Candidatus Dormibacteraeota bacterium]|nr:hypothetical protein [Candidatus Dormibacteraeota bacterium]